MLTENKFARRFFNELKKRIGDLELVNINGLELTTKLGDIEEYSHFLNNSFSEYQRDPDDLNQILDRYINGALALYSPDEPVQLESIVPIIKDNRFLAETLKLNPNFENDYVFEKYNSELYIFYAEDKENSISYLSKERFETLNISLDHLKDKAIDNLNSVIDEIERYGEDGYFSITAGGNYEASLILLNIWKKENFKVDGELVIGIPARDVLIVTGTKSSKNISKLSEVINKINTTGDHIVSDKIFKFNNVFFELWN